MKKIIITGVAGDIGSQIAKYLSIQKFDVHGLARNNIQSKNKAQRIFKKEKLNISFVDFYEINKVKKILNESNHLIHCAGLLKNKAKKESKSKVFLVNSFYTGILASILDQNQEIIYFSSNSVYDIDAGKNISVWIEKIHKYLYQLINQSNIYSSLNEIEIEEKIDQWLKKNKMPKMDLYSVSKYLGELLIQDFKCKFIICRLTNIFGPGYSLKRTIPKIIFNRLSGGIIHINNNLRNYIYEYDINHIIKYLIDSETIKNLIFNFDTQKYITTFNLVKKINFYCPTFYGISSIKIKKNITKGPKLLNKDKFPYLNNFYKLKLSSFEESLRNTIYHIENRIVREMENNNDINFFVHKNERIIKSMLGSSAAQVLLIENKKTGYKFIRKVALREGVEGNGYPKLRSEHDYLTKIRKEYPKLYDLYPKILGSRNYGNSFSLDYEYIEGGINSYRSLLTELTTPETFINLFGQIFEKAIKDGYLNRTIMLKKTDSIREEDNYYLHRANYRINGVIKNKLAINFRTKDKFSFYEIVKKKEIIINNKIYINAPKLIKIINENHKLKSILRVKKNNFCVHGDLTFLNILHDHKNNQFKLIDPRGHYGLWDYIYDIGKLLFTLQGFGNIIESTYTISQKNKGNFEIKLDDIDDEGSNINKAKNKLIEYFESNKYVKMLTEGDDNWLIKTYFAAATHFLADIPYRLYIDKSIKNAFACYLLGTKYLNEAYDRLLKI
jgi:nucleoside-diphosphate-sugar epimerase